MLHKISCKYILDIIFEFILNKKKLNIMKYNKALINRFKIKKINFQNYVKLKEFNTKYKLNIIDFNITELNFDFHNFKNEEIKDLCVMQFNELRKLYLNNNNIKDITGLNKIKTKKLELLDLSWNYLSNINELQRIN